MSTALAAVFGNAEASAAGGDTCAGATAITALPFTDATGDTCSANNDVSNTGPAACSDLPDSYPGADVFYEIALGTGNSVAFSLTTPANATGDLALFLLNQPSCSAAGTCAANSIDVLGASTVPERIKTASYPPGKYYVVVDSVWPSGTPGYCGAYTLSVTGTVGNVTGTGGMGGAGGTGSGGVAGAGGTLTGGAAGNGGASSGGTAGASSGGTAGAPSGGTAGAPSGGAGGTSTGGTGGITGSDAGMNAGGTPSSDGGGMSTGGTATGGTSNAAGGRAGGAGTAGAIGSGGAGNGGSSVTMDAGLAGSAADASTGGTSSGSSGGCNCSLAASEDAHARRTYATSSGFLALALATWLRRRKRRG